MHKTHRGSWLDCPGLLKFMNIPLSTPALQKTTKFTILSVPQIPSLPNIANGTAILTDSSIVRPMELVVGLLHQGTKGVLASGSKAGKTWLLLDLALSVATGTKFLFWHTLQSKVLFINVEIQTPFIKDRLAALMERRGIENPAGLDFWNLRGKTANFEALVANIIKGVKGKGYGLIILDPVYKLMSSRSENLAGGVGALVNRIEQLTEKTGAAVVYAHHFTKGNQAKKAAIDRMSGSGVFARDADTIITLTEHQEEGCYVVETTLRNLPPQPAFVVEWDFPIMVERADLDATELKQNGEDQAEDLDALLDLVQEKGLTTGEWAAAAKEKGYSRATFFRKKGKLEQGGMVQFDQATKKWSCSNHDETDVLLKTVETSETIETPETAPLPRPNSQESEQNSAGPENNNG
jgi:hypothetical protein